MAHNERTAAAAPDVVFDVLADPETYQHWVVGASTIRDASVTWPQVDAVLHHSVGVGPFRLPDRTRVLHAERPTRLVLTARARPFGQARIDIRIEPDGDGSRIHMDEDPSDGIGGLLHNPLVDALIHLRNIETLRRLAAVAEARPSDVTDGSRRPSRR